MSDDDEPEPESSTPDGNAAAKRSTAGAKRSTAGAKRSTTDGEAARQRSSPDDEGAAKRSTASDAGGKHSSATSDSLSSLRDALADRDGAAALNAALVAWRTTRSPALADLIDAISERISPPVVETDQEWSTVAAERDPIDLGSLLPAITILPVSFLPRAAELLGTFPDDPRVAKAAQAWVLEPPTTSSSTYPFWTKLLEVLVRIGDRRLIAVITKRLKKPQEASKMAPKGKPSQFWGRFYAALGRTREKLEELPMPAAIEIPSKLAKHVATLEVIETAMPAPAKRVAAPKLSGPPLAQALAHVNAGRVVDAIDALLVAWRENRAPELANAIDRATRLLPTYDQPFPVEPKAAHAAWQAAFAADPAGAMPQLLQHVNLGGAAAAEAHILDLASLPDDPRVGFRLAEIAGRGDISPERTQYWKTFWELVARTRDTRGNGSLRVQFDDFQGTYYNHHRQGRRIVGDFVLNAAVSALDAAGHTALNQVLAAFAKLEAVQDRTERDLLAAIVADWNDEGPRLVYADWLSDRGHPRGEAIVLGCKLEREKLSNAESKRLGALIGTYRNPANVYGPFSGLAMAFERGLPDRIRPDYQTSTLMWRRIAGDPLLACVSMIELGDLHDPRGQPFAEDFAPVLLDPTATRLAHVVAPPPVLVELVLPVVKHAWKLAGKDLVRR